MSPIDDLSDAELIAAVASVVRTPRADPADSFVLHAPLELAARAALLPRVAPGERSKARAQIAAIATAYEAFGPPAPPRRPHARLARCRRRPVSLTRSRPEISTRSTQSRLGSAATCEATSSAPLLADAIVPSLAAAAHGSIFLFQMPRVAPRGELTGELLRPLAREVARNSDWQLRWFMERDPVGPTLRMRCSRRFRRRRGSVSPAATSSTR